MPSTSGALQAHGRKGRKGLKSSSSYPRMGPVPSTSGPPHFSSQTPLTGVSTDRTFYSSFQIPDKPPCPLSRWLRSPDYCATTQLTKHPAAGLSVFICPPPTHLRSALREFQPHPLFVPFQMLNSICPAIPHKKTDIQRD